MNSLQIPGHRIIHFVKSKDLTPEEILSVPCATCGAAIGEVCELNTGAPRTEAHRDRKLSAAEASDNKIVEPQADV